MVAVAFALAQAPFLTLAADAALIPETIVVARTSAAVEKARNFLDTNYLHD
jgi:hypothetical protein